MEKSFRTEQLTDHITRIVDCMDVSCYLVQGEEKAALLDTGNGLGDIRALAESLTDKPLFVILTHGHLDHMGGAGLFDEVYLHPDDLPVFEKHGDMVFRVEDTNSQCEGGLTEADFVPTYAGEFLPLHDGQVFDLGGIHIKMILVKGHTPGMMCPLVVEDRAIVFGDACGEHVLLFDEYSSTVSEYRKSLLHLKQYESEYDSVFRNHGTFYSSKALLDNVVECTDKVLAHTDAHIPVTMHGAALFAAAAEDPKTGRRADGKEGNLCYSEEKAI